MPQVDGDSRVVQKFWRKLFKNIPSRTSDVIMIRERSCTEVLVPVCDFGEPHGCNWGFYISLDYSPLTMPTLVYWFG